MHLMKAVGIRELKNKLSEYIRQVKAGEEIPVTDRGEVVAELRPPQGLQAEARYPGLLKMSREGRITLGAPNSPEAYPEPAGLLTLEEILGLLDETRGDR